MKKILLILGILISNLTFGQELPNLIITPSGVEPIVVIVEGKTATEMYNKSIDWINETYENPNEVIKAKIENKKIRINGLSKGAWRYTAGIKVVFSVGYSIEISFKDGRYKFEYNINNFYNDSNNGEKMGESYLNFYKKGKVRKYYTESIPSLEKTINNISKSYYNYISGKTDEIEDDW